MNEKEILNRILDNTASPNKPGDIGVLWFGRHFFPDVFDSPFDHLHGRMAIQMWQLYAPHRTKRTERLGYVLVHRESGKTTFNSFLWPLYQIFLKGFSPWVRVYKDGWEGSDNHDYDIIQLPPLNERLILICSETADRAEMFVTNIKSQIEANRDLRRLFGDKHPDGLLVDEDEYERDKMWRKNAFITADNTIVIGKGAGQRVRGINIRNTRPTLVLVDDMYSGVTTKTETTRKKLEYWFKAEVQNSADSLRGKTMVMGTLVHEDTIFTKMQKSDLWFGINIPIIGIDELQKVLQDHCQYKEGVVVVPSKTECARIQKDLKTMSWPERHDLSYILGLYKDGFDDGNLDYFYQEYLNIPRAPENARFTEETFQPIDEYYESTPNGTVMHFQYEGRNWTGVPFMVVGADLASSESLTADETVIFVAGYIRATCPVPGTDTVMERVFPLILEADGGIGWGIHTQGMRKGVADVFVRYLSAEFVMHGVMEINGQQINTLRETTALAQEMGIHKVIFEYISTIRKGDRVLSILEPIAQKYGVILFSRKLASKIHKTYVQMLTLGQKDMKDDWPDGLSIAFAKAMIPPKRALQVHSQWTRAIPANENDSRLRKLAPDTWLTI